jgi:hypothetical protein
MVLVVNNGVRVAVWVRVGLRKGVLVGKVGVRVEVSVRVTVGVRVVVGVGVRVRVAVKGVIPGIVGVSVLGNEVRVAAAVPVADAVRVIVIVVLGTAVVHAVEVRHASMRSSLILSWPYLSSCCTRI